MARYEIEWGGFLSNHVSHGQWALKVLGVPVSLYDRYGEVYSVRLTELPPEVSERELDEAAVLALRGKRREYSAQRLFFARQIAEHGVAATVLHHLPTLLPGLAGAALHPLIHLAVGLREGSDWLLAEALAYLNHSYLNAVSREECAGMGSFAKANAKEFVDAALARTPSAAVAQSGRFQRAMAGLLGNADATGALRAAAVGLDLRLESMFDVSVRQYVGDGRNDYFLLHVVTSSWALGVVCSEVPGLPEHVKYEAVESLAIAAAAAVWIQGDAPVAAQLRVCEPADALAAARSRITALIADPEPRNEHVYKLVAMATERLKQLDTSEQASATAADVIDSIELAMASDFSGRGIGEAPTAPVDLGEASASLHQLVVS